MKKHSKKAVALLLSVLMICAMIPFGTSAAEKPNELIATYTGGTTMKYTLGVGMPKDIVEVKTTASNMAYLGDKGKDPTTFTYSSYKNQSKTPIFKSETDANSMNYASGLSDYVGYGSVSSTETAASNASKANDVFDMTKSSLEVGKGDTFYLGLKVSLENKQEGEGIAYFGAHIAYNDSVFTPTADGNEVVINNILANNINNYQAGTYPDYAGPTAAQLTYSNDLTMTEKLDGNNHEAGQKYMSILYMDTSTVVPYAIPETATWDLLIPITVADDATPGEYYFDIEQGSVKSATGTTGADVATQIGTNGQYTGNGNDGKLDNTNYNRKSANVVTVKVISNDPTIAIPDTQKAIDPLEDQEVVVKYTKGTFKNNTLANYAICKKGETNAVVDAVTEVTLSDSNATATLTVDGTKLTQGEEYTVTLKADGSSPSSGDAADLTTTGTFAVKAAADHTVTIASSGSGITYGDTLTATPVAAASGGVVTSIPETGVTYQWYRGNDKITDATAATYKLGVDDVGKTITCGVTINTADAYGEVKADATTAVAQIILTAPTNANDFTGANALTKSVMKDATGEDKKVTGTYTFSGTLTGDTITATYTAEYGDTTEAKVVNDVAVKTGTWSALQGTNAAGYTWTPPATDITGVAGKVVEEGYQFKATGFTFNPEIAPKDDASTVTISGIPDGAELENVEVASTYGTISEINTAAGTFKFTPVATYPGTAGQPLETPLTITVSKIKLVPEYAGKVYDGTTAVDDLTKITFKVKGTSNAPSGTVTAAGTPVLASASVGTTTLDITNLSLAGADAGDYAIDTTATVNATITAATPTSAAAAAESKPDADAALAAVKAAVVTVTANSGTIEEGKVADYVSDANITAAINAAAVTADAIKSEVAGTYKTDGTDSAGINVTVNVGDTIAADGEAADGFNLSGTGTLTSGAYTIDADTGVITVGNGATPGTISVYNGAAKILDITVATVNPAVADVAALADGNYTVTIDAANVTLGSNYDKNVDIVVTLTIKKGTSFVPTFGFTVTFAAGDHGVITDGEDVVNVEEGGKVEATPVVTPDKGFTFQGWSLDGKTIVNPLTIEILEDTTFTAVYKKGFMDGYGDDKIRPAQNVTRAEFTKMMVIALGKYDYTKTYPATSFTDDKGKWYTNYIACAAELGWIGGYEDNTFKPNDPISRQEAANILYKALENINAHTTTTKITDFDSVATWAQKAVASMVEEGVFGGYEDGTFRPARNISRAEAGKVISAVAGFEPTAEQIAEISKMASPYSDVATTSWAFPYVMFATGNLDDSYYGR